ncbi:MAG: gyrase subunit [Candidatus Atribacteria bacterium]|nr:gyrase subunit [Candidatus Atribacteria bacterium]
MEQKKVSGLEDYRANQIQVLEGLQAVRKRPSMYIGNTGMEGLHHLVFEVVDNSIDEALGGFCSQISVVIHTDGSVTVSDNGRGIPVDIHQEAGRPAVEVVLTKLHAGGKFGKSAYQISGGLHGVGVSVVNALSEWLEVEIRREGKVWKQRYQRGIPQGDLTEEGGAEQSGTVIRFKPDPQIFPDTTFHLEFLSQRLKELSYLNEGLRIILEDERNEVKKEYHFEGGIRSLVSQLSQGKKVIHPEPIYFKEERDGIQVEVAFQYNDGFLENILSYANNIRTSEGGTHLTGFKTSLTRAVNEYIVKHQLIKEKDELPSGNDVREGLCAVVNVLVPEPQFEGQTKTKLGNSEVRSLVDELTYSFLSVFLEENPQVARVIGEKVLQASRAREAARRARELTRKKNSIESGSLPGKLADCSEKNPEEAEIFIVEGDSAGGSAKQGRDRRFQAILPLRGKILNVEKANLGRILSSAEIRNIVAALGCGMGFDFRREKLRYHKVIIMTDADVDGAHIRTLLLTFFYRYMKSLVEEGHIFIALPPLYRIRDGKKDYYAFDDRELETVLKNLKSKKVSLQRYKGLGEMNPEQLWETTMNPLTRTLKRVAVEDALEAEEIFSILMGDAVEPRRDFIKEHALEVVNLDI